MDGVRAAAGAAERWGAVSSSVRQAKDRRQQQRRQRRHAAQWQITHAGHETAPNALGRLRCLTCYRASRAARGPVAPDDGIVDEVVIARLLSGWEVSLTARERAVAAHRLVAAGETIVETGRRLGLSENRVCALLRKPEPGEEFDEDGFYGELDELDGPPEGWVDDEAGLAAAA